MSSKVLIVEDDPLQSEMLSEMLLDNLNFPSLAVNNGQEALNILSANNQSENIKLIIMDIDMPVMSGTEALKIIHQKYPDIPVIMLTGKKNVEKAVECMKLGASDFLNKPYDVARIIVTIKNALKLNALSKEIERLSKSEPDHFTFQNLIGSDEGLSSIIKLGKKAAISDIPVLITGETGTGKEVFARAIHGESNRAEGPFIAVNCGAIPSQLIESTLFGHEKGSFTGATEQTKGKFREADGGTIFLDEIGELPLEAQVKLLRVLQQQEVEPVGASNPVKVNVRILSATNRKLEDEVKEGLFREDLFFRLSVFPLKLSPLRERKIDIPLLAEHFVERYSANDPLGMKRLSSQTYTYLSQQDWPGNVRQLENSIHRAVVMSDHNTLEPKDFQFSEVLQDLNINENPSNLSEETDKHHMIKDDGQLKQLVEIEKETISHALKFTNHNVTKAAEALGIAKSTFYKKMKEYQIA